MNKYKNEPVYCQGIQFASRKEARRYMALSILQRAGKISDLKMQVKYVLIPVLRDENGKLLEREVSYKADFTYYDKDERKTVVEDTKGVRTKEYIIKRKLMLWIYGIRVREV